MRGEECDELLHEEFDFFLNLYFMNRVYKGTRSIFP